MTPSNMLKRENGLPEPPRKASAAIDARYAISVAAFLSKGAFTFLITYWLANHLSLDEFATWATLFSLGVILSIADLGVGQLVLTTFHESSLTNQEKAVLITNSTFTMTLIAVVVLGIALLLLPFHDFLDGIRWKVLLLALILLRLVFIPAGAAIASQNRYHERKVIEALSYAAGCIFVFVGLRLALGLSELLIGMNAFLTLGSLALGLRAYSLGIGAAGFASISIPRVRRIVIESVPYFCHNFSGLVLYGGLIAFTALALGATETARFSLLHNLIFMHLFQVFDLIFRTSQTRLHEPSTRQALTRATALAYVLCAGVAAIAGPRLFGVGFPQFQYSRLELLLYVTFAFLEVYYLLLTIRMQMKASLKGALQAAAIFKTLGFFVLLAGAMTINVPTLRLYAAMLVAFSCASACWLHLVLRRPTYDERGPVVLALS